MSLSRKWVKHLASVARLCLFSVEACSDTLKIPISDSDL